jgi:arsenite methyltransferase
MSGQATSPPTWLLELLGIDDIAEGDELEVLGHGLVLRHGVLRLRALVSDEQAQTSEAFGFKWRRRETFDSPAFRDVIRGWLVEKYGEIEKADWWDEYGERPLVLDAGCGAGFSALELFGKRLDAVRYLGADISPAVDVAAERFAEGGYEGGFLQADLLALPLPEASVDVIYSEGVLHHTDSTERALQALSRLLAPGGRFLFYVYRQKGPIREFTDDYVRERLQSIPPEEAWDALMPLTKLGKALGDLHVTIEVPDEIGLLDIPAGPIDLQRLFHWHVVKAFHRPELSIEELNHINYDWFAPRNAHRQTPEQVRAWCAAAGLEIERERIEESGITVVARKHRVRRIPSS